MTPLKLTGLDQDEVMVVIDQLRLHCANCRGLLAARTGETVAAPRLSPDLFESVGTLTAHATELESKLGDKAPRFELQFPAKAEDAPRSPANTTTSAKRGGATNLTEKCLAEKGITPEAAKEPQLTGLSARCFAANKKK